MIHIMSSTVGLTEARERLTEILERVLEGEEMLVTRYGSPVAAIVPVPAHLDNRPRPLGLAAFAGAVASRPTLYETVADVVALRSLARERRPPEIA
jgi:prevent-host-death family protein